MQNQSSLQSRPSLVLLQIPNLRIMLRRLLNHLRGDLDPRQRPAARRRLGLDVDRVQIIVLLLLLLRVGRLQEALGAGGARRRPAGGASVAVGRHELGEDQGDHGAEEGERGADDGDVAFGGGPVGGADVVV